MEVREVRAEYLAKPGVKQTEVGEIPEDWEARQIHEFASLTTGPFGTLLKASEYSNGEGVPLISVGEIRDGFIRISDETPLVPNAVVQRLPQYLLRRGDIVFGRKGGVERSAPIRQEHEGCFLGSDGICVRPMEGNHPEYLASQFQSHRVQEWLLQHSSGTTMPSLNQEILRRVQIPLPPTSTEQQAIADALGDADALIESLEHLLAKKRQIKQGTMQALLTGHQRLPGFEGAWHDQPLQQICGMKSGTAITSDSIDNSSGYPCFGGNGIRGFTGTFTHDGDFVLVGRQGALCGNVTTVSGRFFASEHAIVVTPNRHLDFRWLALVLERMDLNQFSESSAQPGLSVEKLLLLECRVPELDEQTAIATVLTDMDAEIAALEARLAKVRALKQGMMQTLLTGRIRLV